MRWTRCQAPGRRWQVDPYEARWALSPATWAGWTPSSLGVETPYEAEEAVKTCGAAQDQGGNRRAMAGDTAPHAQHHRHTNDKRHHSDEGWTKRDCGRAGNDDGFCIEWGRRKCARHLRRDDHDGGEERNSDNCAHDRRSENRRRVPECDDRHDNRETTCDQ